MALSFPLAKTDFATKLRIVSAQFDLQRFEEVSGTAGGSVMFNETGFPAWIASVSIAPLELDDAEEVVALLEVIGRRPVYLFNPRKPFPREDPTGAILGSASVTVNSASGRNMNLGGLPSGYKLKVGDMFNVDYSSGRRALFRVGEAVTANGEGNTGGFEVSPPVKAGIEAGDVVTLTRPSAKFVITSYSSGEPSGVIVDGISFTAVETK